MSNSISFSGIVIHGDGYGKHLGFPTANITPSEYLALPNSQKPKEGIYAGRVFALGQFFKAAIVIGPKISESNIKLEAHLLGFSGDLYGHSITFHLHNFLRTFQNYSSENLLKQAIQEDIIYIQETL